MADYNSQGFYQPDYSYDPNQGGYPQGAQTDSYEGQYQYGEGYDQGAVYGEMGQMGGQPPQEMFGQGTGFEEERPLLEELGINFSHVKDKTLAVLNPTVKVDSETANDTDLAGPLVFCLLFGGILLLSGKVHFGYIYGVGLLGCVGMYALLNLMSVNGVSFVCVMSVLGYCILPMVYLSTLSLAVSLQGIVGLLLALATIVWCSYGASKLFVTALSLHDQQLLVAYPCALVYGIFVLLTVF
jgi:hypothetical protein